MAAARATVASPVGASTSIILGGETGWFANDIEEWTAALAALSADREHTRKLGLAGRQRAELEYSLPLSAQQLIRIFKQAVAANGDPGDIANCHDQLDRQWPKLNVAR